LSETFDALVDFVIVLNDAFDSNDGLRGQVGFGMKSCAVGCQLMLACRAAFFEGLCDANGKLFADLLNLLCRRVPAIAGSRWRRFEATVRLRAGDPRASGCGRVQVGVWDWWRSRLPVRVCSGGFAGE
jgi:hypothetical protein